jgi:hypothetical protein
MNIRLRIAFTLGAVFLLTSALALVYNFVYLDRIHGKVIIVQGSGFANKLALVNVVAVRRSDAIAWRSNVQKSCFAVLDEYRKVIAEEKSEKTQNDLAYEQELLGSRASLDAAVEMMGLARRIWLIDAGDSESKRRFYLLSGNDKAGVLGSVEGAAMASNWQKAYDSLKNDVIPTLEAKIAKAQKNKEARVNSISAEFKEKRRELLQRYAELISPEALSIMPSYVEVVASDRTDDTGQFSLRLPRGDYYVFAKSERTVISGVERYYWAQPIATSSQLASKCLLGNMNLVGAGSGDLWEGFAEQQMRAVEAK